MPEDVLHEIFSKLTKKELGRMTKTNPKLREVAKSDNVKLLKLIKRLEKYGGKLDNVRGVDLDTLLVLTGYLNGRGTWPLDPSTHTVFSLPHLILEFVAYAVFGLNKFLSFDDKMIEAKEDENYLYGRSITMSDVVTYDLIQVLMGLDAFSLFNTNQILGDLGIKFSPNSKLQVKSYIKAILERYNPILLTQSKWLSDNTATNEIVKKYIEKQYKSLLRQGWYDELDDDGDDDGDQGDEEYDSTNKEHDTITGRKYQDTFVTGVVADALDSWGISYLSTVIESIEGEHRIFDLMDYYQNIYGSNQISKLRRHKAYNRLRDATVMNVVNTFDISFLTRGFYELMPYPVDGLGEYQSLDRFSHAVVLTRDRDMIKRTFDYVKIYHGDGSAIYKKIYSYLSRVKEAINLYDRERIKYIREKRESGKRESENTK